MSTYRGFGGDHKAQLLLPMLLALALLLAVLIGPAEADDAAPPVLEPTALEESPPLEQSPAAVSARVDEFARAKEMGKRSGTVIIDAGTGQTLYQRDATHMLTPASSMKILTAAAVLQQVGLNTRLSTSVVQPEGGSTVYLVGGGDPLLESGQFKKDPSEPKYPVPTSMKRLAKDTAAALTAAGSKTISLKYDASLFSGPDWNSDWPGYFRTQGIVAPVSALSVDDGRVTRWGVRGEDPSKMAGERFAALLKSRGIKVKSIGAARAPSTAPEIASVSSVPIYELVTQMLSTSDNDTAEVLFRLAGSYGGFGGSFAGGRRAAQRALAELGIPAVLANFEDGSGLSKQDKASPALLAQVLGLSLRGEQDMWPIGSGLAVAGVSGTLTFRFRIEATKSVAGLARAKTGTLTSISSLSGYVPTKSGRVFIFATIANEAKSAFEAAAKMDELVAAMGACGCL